MNQKGSNTVRARAEKRAAERLEALRDRSIFRDSPEGYTRSPEQALHYVYWEPANEGDVEEYGRHRKEVEHFTDRVRNSQIQFVARSYRELWDEWRDISTWDGMKSHLANLEQRYSFSI